MDSQAEPEAVGGGAGAHAAQALAIHLKCKNVTVDFDPELCAVPHAISVWVMTRWRPATRIQQGPVSRGELMCYEYDTRRVWHGASRGRSL